MTPVHSNRTLPFLLIVSFIILFTPSLWAGNLIQRIEIPSSPNPVGSGARALGMGGAFIAIADDATAASWNPGGLVWLDRPEVSVVGAGVYRSEDNSLGIHPEADGDQSVSKANINYMSAVYPFSLAGYEMVASVNYQNLYDFTRNWNFNINQSTPVETSQSEVDYQSEGDLSAIGFAYAIQFSENISMGLTFNIWDDRFSPNEWENRYWQAGSGVDNGDRFEEETFMTDKYSFEGYNFNIGVLWRNLFDNHLTLGAVLKTPFKADLKHNHTFKTATRYTDLPERYNYSFSDGYEKDAALEMPMSYGIGAAWRFSDDFTVSLDIYRTEWDDFTLTDSNGRETSPITGKTKAESDIDPTHQVRMGMEYLGVQTENYAFPLTCGLFYDPAPAQGNPDDFYGFSIGAGITDKYQFTAGLAYQFRFGRDVGTSIFDEWQFSQDVYEHTVYTSVIFYF